MTFLENVNYDWMEMLNFYERPFRAKLIPSKIWTDLDKYRNDAKGLSNYFKKWRTKVVFCKEPSRAILYKNYISVGGEYDPDERRISIIIYTQQFDTFTFQELAWYKFKYRVIQTLLHEAIHFMQYDRRYDEASNYILPHRKVGHEKKDAEKLYLSSFDEIQAYAHCVYMDLKMFHPSKDVVEMLDMRKIKERCPSSTLKYIMKTFDYDAKNNQAIPKLFQQILKWDRKYKGRLNKK